jgi:hypothetical protein
MTVLIYVDPSKRIGDRDASKGSQTWTPRRPPALSHAGHTLRLAYQKCARPR